MWVLFRFLHNILPGVRVDERGIEILPLSRSEAPADGVYLEPNGIGEIPFVLHGHGISISKSIYILYSLVFRY